MKLKARGSQTIQTESTVPIETQIADVPDVLGEAILDQQIILILIFSHKDLPLERGCIERRKEQNKREVRTMNLEWGSGLPMRDFCYSCALVRLETKKYTMLSTREYRGD